MKEGAGLDFDHGLSPPTRMGQTQIADDEWVPRKGAMSPNPGGRPRAALHVQEMARQKTPQAIEALIAALGCPRERVQAAVAILDRAWGRPLAMIAADPERPIAIEFQWASSTENTPNVHADTRAVGTQIEAAIIDAVVAGDTTDEQS